LNTSFYLLSGVLYEPYLLMDAPIGAIFAWFPLEAERAFLPACGEEEGNAVPEAADDGEFDEVRRTESDPVMSLRVGEEVTLEFEGKAVGSIHERLRYWMDNFGTDSFVRGILAEGYRIPVDWSNFPSVTKSLIISPQQKIMTLYARRWLIWLRAVRW
jgi:hypothetical protein